MADRSHPLRHRRLLFSRRPVPVLVRVAAGVEEDAVERLPCALLMVIE
jgi:hypothetical protein